MQQLRSVCEKCAWCCKSININVSYQDILRWAKERRLDILSCISYIDDPDPRKSGFYITDTVTAPKKACPFLDDGNSCGIYDTRPRACAEFPQSYAQEQREVIECPTLEDFSISEDEARELRKSQAMDFVIAEDRKEQLLKILEAARQVVQLMSDIQEFGDDPTEDLYATGFDASRTAWTEVGDSPYLSTQNQPTDYVWTATKKAAEGDWSFADTARPYTDTLNSVTLYVYGQSSSGAVRDTFYLHDGTDWNDADLGAFPNGSWGWVSVDVSSILDTWAKVDGAQMYIAHANNADQTDVDAAYLLIDYTAGVVVIEGVAALSGTGSLSAVGTPVRSGVANLSGTGSLSAIGTPWRYVYDTDTDFVDGWMFEDTGARGDSLLNVNNLTESGSPTSNADSKEGTYSVDLTRSTSDYLYITDGNHTGLDITGDIVINAWIKPQGMSDGDTYIIASKWNNAGEEYGYAIEIRSDGADTGYIRMWCGVNSSTYDKAESTAASILSYNWYHVVGVYDGTDIRIYIDGVLDNNGVDNPRSYSGGMKDNTADFEIGGQDGAAEPYFDGLIDEVFVMDDAITANEVMGLYLHGLQQSVYGVVDLSGTGSLTAIGEIATDIVEGTANLSGTGDLSAQALVEVLAQAALSGAGSLSAVPSIYVMGLANLSGAGDLSAVGTRMKLGTATLSGVGDLSTVPSIFVQGTANLSGAGALSAQALVEVQGAATLSGTGTLSAVPSLFVQGIANLSGVGDLSTVPSLFVQGVASLAGVGSLSAIGTRMRLGAANLSGVGSLSAVPSLYVMAQAALSGTGDLSAQALVEVLAQATLSGAGDLSAIGEIPGAVEGAAVLSGTGSLSAQALVEVLAQATLSGAGSLSAQAQLTIPAQANLSGAGDLSTQALVNVMGQANLSGTGDLSAQALVEVLAQAALSGVGDLSVAGTPVRIGAATLSGIGDLSATPSLYVMGLAVLAGVGDLSTAALLHVLAQATLSGAGDLSAIGQVVTVGVIEGAVVLSGLGSLISGAQLIIPAQANLSGVGDLSASAHRIRFVQAALSGAGDLSTQALVDVMGQATLSGVGDLFVSPSIYIQAQTVLTGAGDLTSGAHLIIPSAAILVGVGDLTVIGGPLVSGVSERAVYKGMWRGMFRRMQVMILLVCIGGLYNVHIQHMGTGDSGSHIQQCGSASGYHSIHQSPYR